MTYRTGYMYGFALVCVIVDRAEDGWRIRPHSDAAWGLFEDAADRRYPTLGAAVAHVRARHPRMDRIPHYRCDSPPLFVSRRSGGWRFHFAADPRTLIGGSWSDARRAELDALYAVDHPSRAAAVATARHWCMAS